MTIVQRRAAWPSLLEVAGTESLLMMWDKSSISKHQTMADTNRVGQTIHLSNCHRRDWLSSCWKTTYIQCRRRYFFIKALLSCTHGVGKSPKKSHSTWPAKPARFTFHFKRSQNGPFGATFGKLEAGGQTVLPDMSNLIEQKLMENAECHKSNNLLVPW